MFRKIFLSLFFLTLFFSSSCLTVVVLAAEMGPPAPTYDPSVITPLKNPTKDVATGATAQAKVANLTGNVIKTVLGIIGSISLVIFIYAGITYMTARGNAEQSKEAVKTAIWAFLGVAMVFLSYLILQMVFNALKP